MIQRHAVVALLATVLCWYATPMITVHAITVSKHRNDPAATAQPATPPPTAANNQVNNQGGGANTQAGGNGNANARVQNNQPTSGYSFRRAFATCAPTGTLKQPAAVSKFLAHDVSQKAIVHGAMMELKETLGNGAICYVSPFGTPGYAFSTAYSDGPKAMPDGYPVFASAFAEAGALDRVSFFINARAGAVDYSSNAKCLLSNVPKNHVNVVADEPMNFVNGLFSGAGAYKAPKASGTLQLNTCKFLVVDLKPSAANGALLKKVAETIGKSPLLSRLPTVFFVQLGVDLYGPALPKPMECEQVHSLGAAKRDDQVVKCGKPLVDFSIQQTNLPTVAFSDAFYAFDGTDKLNNLLYISATPSAKTFVNRESYMRYLNPDFPVAYVSSVVMPGQPELKGPAARFVVPAAAAPVPFNQQAASALDGEPGANAVNPAPPAGTPSKQPTTGPAATAGVPQIL